MSDFTFRYPLVLDRDIPMAGPKDIETDTNLIGTGFRLNNREVNFKWGVKGTEVCPNAEINDYHYYLSSFHTAIQGSENL